jgi:hypothetical protein
MYLPLFFVPLECTYACKGIMDVDLYLSLKYFHDTSKHQFPIWRRFSWSVRLRSKTRKNESIAESCHQKVTFHAFLSDLRAQFVLATLNSRFKFQQSLYITYGDHLKDKGKVLS